LGEIVGLDFIVMVHFRHSIN